ncbi:hypothetical protein Anapl_11128 [Anas platyrhynchos]|uniref:Uncharacterized protein n=1 Tax=Anas platyrhynchos TaxID=8839 RepID=R0JE06_ANAPL|nr:hypothetical protein Anapl_11128 [Anas platyrhynchos]
MGPLPWGTVPSSGCAVLLPAPRTGTRAIESAQISAERGQRWLLVAFCMGRGVCSFGSRAYSEVPIKAAGSTAAAEGSGRELSFQPGEQSVALLGEMKVLGTPQDQARHRVRGREREGEKGEKRNQHKSPAEELPARHMGQQQYQGGRQGSAPELSDSPRCHGYRVSGVGWRSRERSYYGYSPRPFTQLKTGPESEEREKKSPYLHPSHHLLLKGPVYTTVEKASRRAPSDKIKLKLRSSIPGPHPVPQHTLFVSRSPRGCDELTTSYNPPFNWILHASDHLPVNNYRTETKLQRITHFKDSSWGHHHSGLVSNVTGAKQHSHHLDILSLATSSSHTEHSGQSQGFWMVNPRLSCSWYDESISTNKCASAINTPLKPVTESFREHIAPHVPEPMWLGQARRHFPGAVLCQCLLLKAPLRLWLLVWGNRQVAWAGGGGDFPAFFPLARKGKSAEYDRETESARKQAALWPGLQESPLQEGRFACSVSPVQDLAAAGAAHASRTRRHSNAEPWVTSPANADIHLQPQQLQAQPVTCSIQLEGHDA